MFCKKSGSEAKLKKGLMIAMIVETALLAVLLVLVLIVNREDRPQEQAPVEEHAVRGCESYEELVVAYYGAYYDEDISHTDYYHEDMLRAIFESPIAQETRQQTITLRDMTFEEYIEWEEEIADQEAASERSRCGGELDMTFTIVDEKDCDVEELEKRYRDEYEWDGDLEEAKELTVEMTLNNTGETDQTECTVFQIDGRWYMAYGG